MSKLEETETAGRIARCKALLAARTVGGKPMKGYRANVEALRAELAKLEAADAAA